MGLYADKEVTIETTDNGWVLTWSDDKKQWDLDQHFVGTRTVKPKSRGREIFTDEKKLLKRIKDLI